MPTANRGYPYPALTDAPNGPTQVQALADAVDADVQALMALMAAPTWVNLSGFATGVNVGASPPQYAVFPGGRVEMRGNMAATTTFAGGGVTLIAALPSEIVPLSPASSPAATSFATGNSPARFDIAAGLSLFCAAGQIAWVSLNSIRYWLN